MQKPEFDRSPNSLHDLQRYLYEWQRYNFGDHQANERVLMGMCEEAGELCHAQLKMEQGIRGTREDHEEAMKDAVGDISIYMLNYLSGIGRRIPEFAPRTDVAKVNDVTVIRKSVLSVYRLIGKIDVDDVNSASRVQHLITALIYLCALKGWDLETIIRDTWSQISQRDWVLYPGTGLPQ